MTPDKTTQMRNLAALELALAAEITKTRTMTFAVSLAARPAELEPAIRAWIADWSEYHRDQAAPILKHALQVGTDQISARRVTDAVWVHHQLEWSDKSATATIPASAAGGGRLRVTVPANVARSLPTEVVINDEPRTVPAVCARALLDVALGNEVVRFRAETHTKLLENIPEVVPHFVRDNDLKVINKQIAWRPSPTLRDAIHFEAGTSTGT